MKTTVINDAFKLQDKTLQILDEVEKNAAKNFRDNPAKWTCKHLIELVNEFEEDLPQDQQAGVRLPMFGNQTFQIGDVVV